MHNIFKNLVLLYLPVWVFRLQVCLFTICVPGAQGGRKRELDHLELELGGYEPPSVVCWEVKPAASARAASGLNEEPSLQPL